MTRPSQPACPDRRDVLVAVAAGEVQSDLGLEAHLIACAGCRAFFAGVQRQLRALAMLRRQELPRELDGLVVAATQAGFRQDRAVAALRSVGPAAMPREVDRAIWPVGAASMPAFEARREHDEADPSHANVRRFAGRIERLQAPRSLEARVSSILAIGRHRRDRFVKRLSLSVAAALLVAFTIAGTLFIANRPGVVAAEPKFVIERVTSTSELHPYLQETFASLTSGLPDAERIVKEKL